MILREIVVAIGIVLRRGRVLVCRRRKEGHLAGYWEFPGGKCEAGESPADALHREIAEEVAIDVEPLHAFEPMEHEYPEVHLKIHAFVCRHVQGEAQAHASEELQWVAPQDLKTIRFPEANAPLLRQFEEWLASHPHEA
jgi:8-oxo-dGTP diphosphatase